jgi:hypothetical protein
VLQFEKILGILRLEKRRILVLSDKNF